jgi:hypothetical protein
MLGFDCAGRMIMHFPRFRDGHTRLYATSETAAAPHAVGDATSAGWHLLCTDAKGLRRVQREWCSVVDRSAGGDAGESSAKRQRVGDDGAALAPPSRTSSSADRAACAKLSKHIGIIEKRAAEAEQRWVKRRRGRDPAVDAVLAAAAAPTTQRRSTRVVAMSIGKIEDAKESKQAELIKLLDADARKGLALSSDEAGEESDDSEDRSGLRSSTRGAGRDRVHYAALPPRAARSKAAGARSARAEQRSSKLVCSVCSVRDGAAVLCERRGCGAAFHIACLDPPLSALPKGNWFCPDCIDAGYDPADTTDAVKKHERVRTGTSSMTSAAYYAAGATYCARSEAALTKSIPLERPPRRLRVVWALRKGVLRAMEWIECRASDTDVVLAAKGEVKAKATAALFAAAAAAAAPTPAPPSSANGSEAKAPEDTAAVSTGAEFGECAQ